MAWDVALFHSINQWAGRYELLDTAGIFAASYLLPLLIALAIPAVILGKHVLGESSWKVFTRVMLSAALGYGIRFMVGIVAFRSRPFVALTDTYLLISKDPTESSFPSGHATAAFAIAFYLYRVNRIWGALFLILATLVSLGRVFVGVHFPLDIVGGLVVGWFSAMVISRFEKHEWQKLQHRLK